MTGCVPSCYLSVAEQDVVDDRLPVEPIEEGLANTLVILEEFGLLGIEIGHDSR